MQYAMQPRFQCFSAPSNCREGIVDLVRYASREKSHTGQLLIADDFLGPFTNLLVEILLDRKKTLSPQVDGSRQFRNLVQTRCVDAVTEIPRSDLPRAIKQILERTDDGGSRINNQTNKQPHR